MPSFEIQDHIFTGLSVFDSPKGSSNTFKTHKNISLYFKRRYLIIYNYSDSETDSTDTDNDLDHKRKERYQGKKNHEREKKNSKSKGHENGKSKKYKADSAKKEETVPSSMPSKM